MGQGALAIEGTNKMQTEKEEGEKRERRGDANTQTR